MSDIDVIIRVHTQGVQEIGNLSASLRGLSTSLRNINVPMSRLDTSSRAVYKALGVTSRGVDNHAKSIKELVRNQKVLGAETKNITRDLNGLRNAYALAGRESTALGRAIGVSANELSGFSRTFRGMRLRAFGSDLNSVALRMTKLGKDAQFVGRSLMINLTLPLATFARVGLRSFLAIEKQQVRLVKVMENLASTADIAREKILGLGSTRALTPEQEIRAKAMVKAFKDMDDALTALSLKFGVSKELTTSLAADFAELGITSEENVKSITRLTLEIEKLGSMDIGPAQDLSQALFFQSKRAFEVTGAFRKLTTARQREEKAIQSSTAQMYLFNAIENATALTLKDLGDSFAEISAMATSYGLSMTEAAALLAPMKAAGLDVGASANSIKVSLQRLLAPTKQNTKELQKLAEQFGVAGDAQNEFAMSTKTGLVGLSAVVKMFDKVRKSSQGSEGALRLMSDLFEKRQGPRMYLAIEQLADFNNELARVGDEFANLNVETAEARLVRAAESAAGAFTNFNTTVVPKTIRSFQDIGKVARIATAFEGQIIEFEPGVETKITAQDIANAKAMRKAVADTVLEAKRLEGIDIISEVKTESGRALMIQLAGATNAADVAQQELARSLATAGVSIESLKTTFKMFAADIVSGLMPTIKSLSEKVQQMYNTWNSEDFAQTRQNIIRLITVVGGILGILGPITLAIGTLQSVIGKFGLVISRFIPKLKNADGEFTRLGQSAQFAKKQINGVYEAFVQASGMRAIGNALAASRPTGLASPAFTPKTPEAVTAARRTQLIDQQKREAMRAAGVTAAERRMAQKEFAAGTKAPTTGARVRGTSGRFLPRNVVEGLKIIEASELARVTPTGVGSKPSTGRFASRTEAMLAPIRRQESVFARSPYLEKAGVSTDRMGTRFIRRGRLITEGQANDLAMGGARGVRARAGILRETVRSGIAARPGIAAARAAMASAPSTGAGIAQGAVAGIKASTNAMVQNMSSVKGAQAAVAALNAQYGAFNKQPGTIKKMATAMLGFVKNLKVATLAARIFNLTLMMSGIGAIIAIVAGVIYLVVKNMDKIKGSAKVMEPLKRAFTAVKDAVFMVIRPIQDLFAQFGSGADEGEKSGNAIVSAFEGIAAAVEFVAGLFKLFVEKVIQPYLYGIVNIVMAVVSMFKGNWGDAFNFLLAGVGSIVKGVINLFIGLGVGIVNAIAKAITIVLDLFGKIPIIGGVFKLASKGINALADGYKKVATGVADFATGQLDKIIDKGIKKSTNTIQKGKKPIVDTAEDIGEGAGEAISNAYGNADMESASEKIKKKIKEGLADKAQELYDYVVERFSSSISKFVTESVKALNKQKEAALKVFDIQINTLVKLEKAEESLTRAKEYETNRRKLIDDAALRQQNYVRDRALAIYEGRVDDARILDQEERVASRESDSEIATLDQGRRKDLAKENLESLKDAIKDAQEVAGRFFDESIEKFQEAAAHITRIAPVTQEQYAAQLEELRLKTVEYSDKNNLEFGAMFEKFATTITDRMPNTVDQFGQALGMFTEPFDELVALAKEKYGLGSENDNTVLGVTKGMSDAVIGTTLGMVTGIGDTFTTQGPIVIEELKTAFINPFKKALDEADPITVFKNAIIDGNEEILNSFRKTLKLNPDLMEKISKSLDPAIAKYFALQAAAEAAADAMNNAGGGSPGDYTDVYAGMDAETRRFARIKEGIDAGIHTSLMNQGDSYSRRLAQSGNFQRIYEGRNTELLTNLPIQIRNRTNTNPVNREVGGPIPKSGVLGTDGMGVTGFLNAPTTQGIPAILHGGEFVVNAEAVKRVGLGALAKINDSRIPKFKKGGLVGAPDRAERMALARKPSGTSAAYVGRLITPQEKFAVASVGNFKRTVERAEAPVEDTRSFKQKTFDVVKGLGMVAKNIGGSALDQFSKIGAQDGLIDKLTRFDKSSVDLIAGGIGRSGKILKGAYDNVLYPMAESLNATFINPAINTGGRLIGKNPNLREAGMIESALNVADVASTVFTLGASKVATTTGRAGLTAVLKEMAKGAVKTSDEMLAQKLLTMGMAGKFPTKTAQLIPSNFGIDATSLRPKAPIRDVRKVIPPQLALPGGPKILELMPGPAQTPTPGMSIPTPSVERIGGAIPLPRPTVTSSLPRADLSEYILHGGPRADELMGGVLNPDFVRGGVVQRILRKYNLNKAVGRADQADPTQGSVLDLGNRSISNYILYAYQQVADVLANPTRHFPEEYVQNYFRGSLGDTPSIAGRRYKYSSITNKTAYHWGDQVAFAQKWIKENEEIVRRVLRGETNFTGVAPALYGEATGAYQYGGIHLVKVPKSINPSVGGINRDFLITPSLPGGERVFWGIHKPVASANASWESSQYADGLEAYRRLIHSMIEDANKNLTPQQLADFALSQKIYGNQITPGAREFIVNSIKNGRRIFKNPEEIGEMLEKATTKDEMLDIIKTKTQRRNPIGYNSDDDRVYDLTLQKYIDMINEYTSPMALDPAEVLKNQRLDSVIHSGVDAVSLGVADQVGMITYREALIKKQIQDILSKITDSADRQIMLDALSGIPVNQKYLPDYPNIDEIVKLASGAKELAYPSSPIKMLGEAMNSVPAASVQDAMLSVTRRSGDSIAYVRDADPLDLMGNTPFTPPVIKPPLVARSFSEQLEVFKALGRLAGTKNAPLRPYQQTLIEEYTNNFNKLLTLRALDLSGNKVGLEAYVARVGKLYGADGSFGHPIKPNSGIPLMERMEAAGLFGGSLRFADVLDNPEIQQMIDVLMRDMNEAMRAGSVVYPENIETYRGLSLLAPVDDPRKYFDHLYRPGYMLPGQYASTSVNEEVAKSFSSGPLLKSTNPYSSTYETIPILEHITIPKGNEVFSPSYYGLGLQNEREIIIPPAYRLRIDDILEPDAGGNGYFRVQATAVKAAAMAGLGGVGIVGASMIPTPSQAQAMTADTMERVQSQKIAYYESVRRLNDFIASQETNNVSDPYNAIHSRMEPVADLTSMTIRQAIDFATQFKLSNTKSSGAIGKYQNLPGYLGDRARLAGLTLDSLYDEKTQELIAQSFLLKSLGGNGIGLENYLSGRKSQKYMIDRIANIYRGMPGSDGRFVGEGSNKEGSDLNMLGNLKNYLTAAKSLYMPGFKEGGFVGGMPSTAIPAMLHGGEYVINAKAVQQLGLPYLNAMNQISQSQFRPPSSRVNAPTGAVTNNVSTVNIQVENFVGEEAWFESMMEEYNINVLPKNQKLAGLEKRKFSTYNGINQGL